MAVIALVLCNIIGIVTLTVCCKNDCETVNRMKLKGMCSGEDNFQNIVDPLDTILFFLIFVDMS